MKKTRSKIYICFFLFFFFSIILHLEAKVTEVSAVETTGVIEFFRESESPNNPDPPPDIKYPDTENLDLERILPQTNFIFQGHWIGIGFFIVIFTVSLFVSINFPPAKK